MISRVKLQLNTAKKRVYATLMFLLIGGILLAVASYAWIVLSTAPEITAAATTLSSNGALEVALLTTSSYKDPSSIINYVGDSLDVQNATDANLTWGNLIDLSDESYGLQKISLKPAYIYTGSADGDEDSADGTDDETEDSYVYTSLLAVPTYGNDGRISDTEATVSGVYDYTSSFGFNAASQEYGVRAVGTVSSYVSDLIETVNNRLTITDTYGYIVDMAFRSNTDTDIMLQTEAVDRTGYEGWDSATSGTGSKIVFEYSDDLTAEQAQELLSAIKVTFYDPESMEIYGIAAISSVTIDESANTVTGALSMTDETSESGFSDGKIASLETAAVKKVSMLVYMDGETLSNADLSISGNAGKMTLNVQFSSSVELTPTYNDGEYGDVEDSGGLYIKFNDNMLTIYGRGTVSAADVEAYRDVTQIVVIRSGITEIAQGTFDSFGILESVTIANTVTFIGEGAFNECNALTQVYITDTAAWCGITFSNDSANPLTYAHNLYLDGELVTRLVIPGGVKSIGKYAFYGCTSITSASLPAGVTEINSYAFGKCTNLTGITLPEGLSTIGDYAFYYCSSATEIAIPKGVTAIGERTFAYCGSLTSIDIPEGVTSIGDYAFYSCKSATSINISEGVTSIGEYAFYNCNSATSVTIPASVETIGSGTFSVCSGLKDVYITDLAAWNNILFKSATANPFYKANNLYLNGELVTDLVIPDGTTSIGNYAYYNCTGLTSVTIPKSVTSIGVSTFYGCTNLTAVYIEDAAAWCKIDFTSNPLTYAKNLYLNGELATDLVIPSETTTVNSYAFQGCTSIESVTLPEGVTWIGIYAFKDCTNLKSINIPESVNSLGNYAFSGCTSLNSINIPAKVKSIGTDAFYNCKNLNSLYITDLKAWCDLVFSSANTNPLYYAKNLYLNGELVTDLVIPDGVTKIKNFTFDNCTSIKSVTLPAGVTSIGTHSFYGCTNLASINIPDGVKSFGEYAFYNCKALTSINIPASVTSVGSNAFYYCSKLTGVYITDVAAWCGINFGNASANPLYYAKNLYLNGKLVTDIVIPDGTTSIGNYAYYNCSGLKNVTIPSSLTSVGNQAFYNCTGLKGVYITDLTAWCKINFYTSGTSTTYSNPLYHAGNLYLNGELITELVIPDGITAIKARTFIGLTSVTSVTIPEGVTGIGYHAFYYCTNLTVTIPTSIVAISSRAFGDTNCLAVVNYAGTMAQWNSISKASDWNYGTTSCVIHCTDGDITS